MTLFDLEPVPVAEPIRPGDLVDHAGVPKVVTAVSPTHATVMLNRVAELVPLSALTWIEHRR